MKTRMALAGVAAAAALAAWSVPAGGSNAGAGAAEPAQIVVTEQASDRILVLGSDEPSWDRAAVDWSWRPTVANGLGDLVDAWGAPDEAKLRRLGDQQYLLTTDSEGLAAVIPYPQGTGAHWAGDVERGPTSDPDSIENPHSIELLPNGNVAVVASTGDWLRVYAASRGPRARDYVEFELEDGHGVQWDEREILWALGGDDLVGLRVRGTAARPQLEEVRRTPLPTHGGHDLTPVHADPDRLWITTVAGVYQYSISRDEFLTRFPAAERIDGEDVKAVGDHPATGQVLTSRLQVGNVCTWCTDTVDLFRPIGRRVLRGAQIYKARWWAEEAR